jgi:hypothetical protein
MYQVLSSHSNSLLQVGQATFVEADLFQYVIVQHVEEEPQSYESDSPSSP